MRFAIAPRLKLFLRAGLLAALLSAPLQAAPLTAPARAEIDALLARLAASGCQFKRNGAWHTADAARQHLRRKFDYLVDRGQVASAEQFIERAASRSSVSGAAYEVRCGDRPPTASGPWLHGELRALRAVRSD